MDATKDSELHRKYHCVDSLPASLVQELSTVMKQLDVIYPTEQEMQLITNWLLKGIRGETLTIFSPICPDYSVEETGDPRCPYRHTFNQVGSGIGAIAHRLLKAYPYLESMLTKHGIKLNIVVGLGDFEALSESNLKRVNVTQEEFLNRCQKSKTAFENACLVPTEVYMITDLCDGHQAWLDTFEHFKNRLHKQDFGQSNLTREKLLTIVEKRKNLYDRWFGKKDTLEEYLPYAITQGAEYAAVGAIISKCRDNCFVLGADNDAMAPFYSIEKTTPTLYLERYYC